MEKILILKAGSTFSELKAQKGDFEHWIIASSGLQKEKFIIWPIERLNEFDLTRVSLHSVIITGSHDNVTEDPSYLEAAFSFLKKIRELQVPVLGICYGHQLLAAAFGGEVTTLANGPEFGAVKIIKTPETQDDLLFSSLPPEFLAFMSHQQTVQQLPPGAIKLAYSSKDQHAAFYLKPNIWGVQFHPEFDEKIMRFYLKKHFKINEKETEKYLNVCSQASSLIPRFLSDAWQSD